MFDIGWPELLVVAVVLIVIVGPKDLPGMLRTFGRTTNKLRAMAGDFRRQFDDALKEAELGDVKDLVDTARSLDPRAELKKHLNPLDELGKEIKSDLTETVKSVQKDLSDVSGGSAADTPVEKPEADPLPAVKPKAIKQRRKSAGGSASTSKAKPKRATKTKPATGKKTAGAKVTESKA